MTLYDSETKRLCSKKSQESYESFYDRTFRTVDINELIRKGASINKDLFREKTKDAIALDYWKAMFENPYTERRIEGKIKHDKAILGKIEFGIFQEKTGIPLIRDKRERWHVSAGKSLETKERTYKPGWFIPKAYYPD